MYHRVVGFDIQEFSEMLFGFIKPAGLFEHVSELTPKRTSCAPVTGSIFQTAKSGPGRSLV